MIFHGSPLEIDNRGRGRGESYAKLAVVGWGAKIVPRSIPRAVGADGCAAERDAGRGGNVAAGRSKENLLSARISSAGRNRHRRVAGHAVSMLLVDQRDE